MRGNYNEKTCTQKYVPDLENAFIEQCTLGIHACTKIKHKMLTSSPAPLVISVSQKKATIKVGFFRAMAPVK